MDNYIKGKLLGKGSFGSVYLGQSDVGARNKQIVLKEISLTGLSKKEVEKTYKEANLISTLKHPHIIKYYGHKINEDLLTIAMEFAENGTLKEYIDKQQGVPMEELQVIKYFSQLLLAIDYIHELNIIHRDICNKNILITNNNNTLKLADFGISRRMESLSNSSGQQLAGHPGNIAPELYHGGRCTKSSDMWSLGCILYELTSLRSPFFAPTLAGHLLLIVSESQTPKIPVNYNKLLQTLVTCLLCRDPTARPSARSLLAHPILAQTIHTLPVLYCNDQSHNNVVQLSDGDKELIKYFCPHIFLIE